jgi:uncharacterized protein involved in exopolysaccharide biosynthesis
MAPSPRQFTLRDALRGLSRKRRIAVLFFLTINALVLLGTLLCPKSYRSEAKLFVRLGRENVRLDATAALGQGPVVAMPSSRESELNSVAEAVSSRSMIEQAVDEIGPALVLDPDAQHEDASPSAVGTYLSRLAAWLPSSGLSQRERAIIKFGRKLDVEAVPRSNVVTVGYEAGTPTLAQRIVAEVVQIYLAEHVRLNRTAGAHEFLNQQIHQARQELDAKETELKSFRAESGVIDPPAQSAVLVNRKARLEDELLDANASLSASEVEIQELEQALAKLSQTRVVAQTTGAGNEAIDRMREQLYLLQIRQEDLLARYTADHYKVKQLRDQIAEAKAILSEEESRRTEKTEGPNETYEATRLELIRKKPVLAALRVKTQKLTEQLREVEADLDSFNSDLLQVTALEREVDILEQNYRRYAYNLEQAQIDESLENQQISNVSVQPATLSEKPVRPNKLINLILGLVLGTLGGLSCAIVCEFLDTRLVTSAQMEAEMALPLLVSIPSIGAAEFDSGPQPMEVSYRA